jgi:hypothetical protein
MFSVSSPEYISSIEGERDELVQDEKPQPPAAATTASFARKKRDLPIWEMGTRVQTFLKCGSDFRG